MACSAVLGIWTFFSNATVNPSACFAMTLRCASDNLEQHGPVFPKACEAADKDPPDIKWDDEWRLILHGWDAHVSHHLAAAGCQPGSNVILLLPGRTVPVANCPRPPNLMRVCSISGSSRRGSTQLRGLRTTRPTRRGVLGLTLRRALRPPHFQAGMRPTGTWKLWRAPTRLPRIVPCHRTRPPYPVAIPKRTMPRPAAPSGPTCPRWLVACRRCARLHGRHAAEEVRQLDAESATHVTRHDDQPAATDAGTLYASWSGCVLSGPLIPPSAELRHQLRLGGGGARHITG